MNNLTICYPGGAGGNWISNLIHCLTHSIYPEPSNVNFHSHNKSTQVQLTHDVSNKQQVFFNGQALFNIYLNVVLKFRLTEQVLYSKSIREQFETLASEASSKLFFVDERVDINWNDIFCNETAFVDSLYSVLDSHHVIYNKNNNIVKQALINYRASCVNPKNYFGNFDNLLWLGWCNGISKHLWKDWPLVDSVVEMQNFLRPKQEFFKEFTEQYILNYE